LHENEEKGGKGKKEESSDGRSRLGPSGKGMTFFSSGGGTLGRGSGKGWTVGGIKEVRRRGSIPHRGKPLPERELRNTELGFVTRTPTGNEASHGKKKKEKKGSRICRKNQRQS